MRHIYILLIITISLFFTTTIVAGGSLTQQGSSEVSFSTQWVHDLWLDFINMVAEIADQSSTTTDPEPDPEPEESTEDQESEESGSVREFGPIINPSG